jgi:peptidyl-Asp metalloendopeptidase
LTDFQVQGWTGSAWITLSTVSGNNLVKRLVLFNAYTTDRIRILVTGAKDRLWSRITEVEAWTSTVTASMTNYALASNGATASASSVHDAGYAASGAIDNRRSGANWGSGGGWNDGTASTFPDWLQINFNGKKTIDHVVVYSVQDNFLNPAEPTDSMTFTLYGLMDFQVQGWTGSAWITLGTVSGNNLVKRLVFFNAYTTDRIRILVTGAKDRLWSRITEVEGWGN